MKLNIIHFSQNNTQIPEPDQNKSCGICCVKMLLDFLFRDNTHSINDLIQEATLIKAFNREINNGYWTHDGLVRILRNHGALAYPQEFKSVHVNIEKQIFEENQNQENFTQKGIEKIKQKLEEGKPAIVSVTAGFNKNKDSHMVIISGYDGVDGNTQSIEYLYVKDPQDETFEKVSTDKFLNHWKKLAIFID